MPGLGRERVQAAFCVNEAPGSSMRRAKERDGFGAGQD